MILDYLLIIATVAKSEIYVFIYDLTFVRSRRHLVGHHTEACWTDIVEKPVVLSMGVDTLQPKIKYFTV